MKAITVVSATLMEVQPLIDYLSAHAEQISAHQYTFGNTKIDILISGIGILHTTYTLMEYLRDHTPDFWIQAGIGGAFDPALGIGNVYVIESERLIDFGAQDKDGTVLSPFNLRWLDKNTYPYTDEVLVCPAMPVKIDLPRATGMTTIHSHGNIQAIEKVRSNKHAQIENMEGAAFFYVSLMKNIPFASIRSISNMVEERNQEKWDFKKSINTLNTEILKIISEL